MYFHFVVVQYFVKLSKKYNFSYFIFRDQRSFLITELLPFYIEKSLLGVLMMIFITLEPPVFIIKRIFSLNMVCIWSFFVVPLNQKSVNYHNPKQVKVSWLVKFVWCAQNHFSSHQMTALIKRARDTLWRGGWGIRRATGSCPNLTRSNAGEMNWCILTR